MDRRRDRRKRRRKDHQKNQVTHHLREGPPTSVRFPVCGIGCSAWHALGVAKAVTRVP